MICPSSDQLDRYVDGELSGAELDGFETHLQGCTACAVEALSRLQLKRTTAAAGRRFIASPEFRAKIAQSIRPRKRSRWALSWPTRTMLAAAGAVAVLLIAGGLWLARPHDQRVAGELADLHVSTLASANPIDVASSDRHTVKPWFQGKLPFTFDLPEFQNTAFKLAGGRLAYLEQNPGAQLLVTIRNHRLSVFIFLDRAELSAPGGNAVQTKTLAFNMDTWTQGGLRYFVIGDASPSDTQQLCALFKSAARSGR